MTTTAVVLAVVAIALGGAAGIILNELLPGSWHPHWPKLPPIPPEPDMYPPSGPVGTWRTPPYGVWPDADNGDH